MLLVAESRERGNSRLHLIHVADLEIIRGVCDRMRKNQRIEHVNPGVRWTLGSQIMQPARWADLKIDALLQQQHYSRRQAHFPCSSIGS